MHKRGAGIGFGGGLPVWPKTQNVSVGADSISARGRSPPPQGPAGWGIPPYGRPDGRGLPI